ncbi:MAG: hypothetical protein KME28_09110 [Pelatocladus maniniholoensis HA4357-MV3]|jgi:hypothetical protein|uniref:Uncharacterized protein n=1 Tax=Pelatocladus maniniholoensis HA4357-MV3 TaxID=1117104 RepID=A0A9E3H759_9NOST|nr:hypothetical protein [Pelatocladus maniniholoensis HA4357-MV3]BAZ68328.1 hypothetical protein NIES4106_30890 [Fischerella sp. NIES-4106]
MLRLYHLIIGAALLVFVPLGLKVTGSNSSQKSDSAKVVQVSRATTASPNGNNVWKKFVEKTASPKGWQVLPCDGNTSLLCISANGQRIGTVEMLILPLEKQPNFQKFLAQAGIDPSKKIDSQNPQYQTQLSSALNTWVNEHYAGLEKDRQGSYGDRINFSSYPSQKVQIGKLPGVRYGFVGLKRQGGVQEQHVGYVTFDGKALYVIATAFDPASQTGKFDKLENLAVFEPYLDAIALNLRLPNSI